MTTPLHLVRRRASTRTLGAAVLVIIPALYVLPLFVPDPSLAWASQDETCCHRPTIRAIQTQGLVASITDYEHYRSATAPLYHMAMSLVLDRVDDRFPRGRAMNSTNAAAGPPAAGRPMPEARAWPAVSTSPSLRCSAGGDRMDRPDARWRVARPRWNRRRGSHRDRATLPPPGPAAVGEGHERPGNRR